MRISVSGTASCGKTTLIKNILAVWPNYTTPEKTYRDIITDKGLPHSSKTTTETQTDVLNFMIDQMQKYDKTDKVVFDRCPLDNLAYTLHAHEKGVEGFDKAYVDKAINICRESLRSLDIIFLLRYDPSIPIVEDDMRDTDSTFIKEIDNIFAAFKTQYDYNNEANVFFPKHDSPCIIELGASAKDRITTIQEYIDSRGEPWGDEGSIFNPNNLEEMEKLVRQQKLALEQEQKEKELFKKFGLK